MRKKNICFTNKHGFVNTFITLKTIDCYVYKTWDLISLIGDIVVRSYILLETSWPQY